MFVHCVIKIENKIYVYCHPHVLNNEERKYNLLLKIDLYILERNIIGTISVKKLYLADNGMFKVNNRNTRKRCEICSKLTIKTPEPRH